MPGVAPLAWQASVPEQVAVAERHRRGGEGCRRLGPRAEKGITAHGRARATAAGSHLRAGPLGDRTGGNAAPALRERPRNRRPLPWQLPPTAGEGGCPCAARMRRSRRVREVLDPPTAPIRIRILGAQSEPAGRGGHRLPPVLPTNHGGCCV